MVRDPRAIVASYRDWKNQGGFDFEKDAGHREALALEEARARSSYHILIQAMLWRGVANAALGARDRFGEARVRVQRYEDFVADPAAASAAIMDWLGLAWNLELLAVPMHNSSFSSFDEGAGISREAVDRWRSKLSPAEIAAVQDACGGLMDRLGYPRAPTGLAPGRVVPWATLPFALLAAVRANRDRMEACPPTSCAGCASPPVAADRSSAFALHFNPDVSLSMWIVHGRCIAQAVGRHERNARRAIGRNPCQAGAAAAPRSRSK